MEREINNNEFSSSNGRNDGMNERERLEGLAASEMADRGPKSMSGFTGEDDGTETRPVSHLYAEPGGKGGGAIDGDDADDDDDDFDDDDDLDIDEDIEVEDDAVEIDDTITDDDLEDDDLVLDDDDEDEEDDL